jgi:hypothetical protein
MTNLYIVGDVDSPDFIGTDSDDAQDYARANDFDTISVFSLDNEVEAEMKYDLSSYASSGYTFLVGYDARYLDYAGSDSDDAESAANENGRDIYVYDGTSLVATVEAEKTWDI